jgi:cytidylate kinase
MAVITVSRGYFSGGEQLAQCVATRLGYYCVDREALLEKAAACGISEDDLREALVQPPSLLSRFKHRKRAYLAIIQATLAEEVREGCAVYHGHAGHLLLQGIRHVLRVRIVAPLEFRMALLKERKGIAGREAEELLLRLDEERRKWTQYLYGVDWNDPGLYDIVVNLERMCLDEACAVVSSAAEQTRFRENTESMQAMADLALASRVRAALVLFPVTSHLEIEVSAYKGTIFLRGELPSPKLKEKLKQMIGGLPGVQKVDLELLVSQWEQRSF